MRRVEELRPLTAGRLLALWRECRETEDPLERVLLCNGRILAECCFAGDERVYEDGLAALEDLTGRQMEKLLLRLAGGGGPEEDRPGAGTVNPEFDAARFAALWRE
nr:hypothetical protein [uncultured Oscillibacter sp.]